MEQLFRFIEKYISLSAEERSLVLSQNKIQSFKKNSILKRASEPSPVSYFVLSGCVYSIYPHEKHEIISEFYTDGEPVLLMDPHYELRCSEDTLVAVSSIGDAEENLKKFPNFGIVCRKFAEERLQKSLAFADRLKALSPTERFESLKRERPELLNKVPQHLIASYLDMAPETLSRLRRQMLFR